MAPPYDLPLPDPPETADLLDAPPDDLVHASRAHRRPFVVGSPALEVHGDELRGVERASTDAGDLLREVRTGGGPCSTVLVGPRGLRRELVGPGGTVLETLLVADRHPGLVIQWSVPSEGTLALDVRWRVPEAAAQRASDSVLRVRRAHGPDRLFALLPRPERWAMETGPEGLEIRARIVARDGPVTLLAGSVARTDDGTALLGVLSRGSALDARTRTHLTELRHERLATRTGVGELDDGLAWAVARASDASPGRLSRSYMGRLWMVVGLLAAGDHRGARRWLEAPLRDAGDVLALGWWMRWSGDAGPLRRHGDLAQEILARAEPRSELPDVVERASREALADAFEALGQRAGADRVRGETGPTKMVLPVLGRPAPEGRDEAILDAILETRFPTPRTPLPPGSSGPLGAWALFALGRPDEAYRVLREHLASGVAGRDHDPRADALSAAAVLHGLLGARAEARWGRLTLAPALPGSWARFRADGIRVDDARVSLRYARREGTHTFCLQQTTGRVPLNLVFEPSVPGPVHRVSVDGEPTDVVPEVGTHRTRTRLQLPLDAERKVTLVRPEA